MNITRRQLADALDAVPPDDDPDEFAAALLDHIRSARRQSEDKDAYRLDSSVSFTASRLLPAASESTVTSVLTVHVPAARRYVTGACVGGDAFIGRWLFDHRPEAEHVVIVPADRSRVDPWWLDVGGAPVTVIEMPPGTTYADRNRRLVAEGSAVFAFPAYPEDDPRSRRSGTWQAGRMARRAGKLSMWQAVMAPYASGPEARPEEHPGEEATRMAEVIDWLRTPEGEQWSEDRICVARDAAGQRVSLTRYGDEAGRLFLGGVISVKPG